MTRTESEVSDSDAEEAVLSERIANLSLESESGPVLVPFTSADVELWKDFCQFRRNRRTWDAYRQEEWKKHHPPHIHELFKNWPILETPRLRLRLLREEDAEAVFRVTSDEKSMKYYGTVPHKDLEYTKKNFVEIFVSRFKLRDAACFVVTLKNENSTTVPDEYIGHINIFGFDRPFNFAEIAYILDPAYWGKGIATEAVGRVVEFLMKDMKIHKIRAGCYAENVSSRRVLERCGFKQEGCLRDNVMIDGKYVDEYLWAIIATELDA